MATSEDQYKKVHGYLLENGQQELAGHLDTLWQEVTDLRSRVEQPERQNMQDFQDQAAAPGENADEVNDSADNNKLEEGETPQPSNQ